MFEVTQLDVCPKTGITSFEIKWNLGRGVKTDQGSFMNREDALRYINSSKRSYILTIYDNFVNDCRTNFEIGDSEYYNNELKITALQRCSKYAFWFVTQDDQTIVKVIQALHDDLRKILPKPSDNSFAVLETRIMDMIIFCKKELNSSLTPQSR